jgi:transcriptional regulator with GAF, ATPase, and Fis domain
MAARLMAVAGPLDGSTFPLPDGEVTIGRDSNNVLCVAGDDDISQRHAVIHAQNQQFTIRDLSDCSRTYVNQLPVREQLLEHGDAVRTGRSVFVFLVDGQPIPRSSPAVDLDDGKRVPGAAQTVRRGDALYLDRETLLGAVAQSDRSGRIVQSVLRACRALLAVHRLQDLQQHLVEFVLNAIPAERAAVLLASDHAEEFASAFHWIRATGESRSFRLPRAVIRHVLTDGTALCFNAAPYTVWSSDTIMQARLSSIIAVPLVVSNAIRGAMYADVSDPSVRFSDDDLQLLTGIAELSAAPLVNALRMEQLESENERLLAERAGSRPLVGAGERMRAVHRFVVKVASSDSTVLIAGGSGTGKELVAQAIHRTSARSGKPFVAINCAAITETLLESEFFGHEKGAFTGAYAQKKGKLEEAEGGTVFLDEIGELALPLQAKLLRVLQEREFERVGGTRPIKANVRIVAATNRNLEQEIKRGTFRADLFYRLNVVGLTMPDLRDRREDIPLLANYFLRKHSKGCTRRITGLSDEALSCLAAYDWPGNVRELENVIERATVLGTTEHILPDDLPESIVESRVDRSPGTRFHQTIREIKRQLVTKALEQTGGSYVEAARTLGLHPNNLYRLVKTLNLGSKQ